MDKKRGYTRYAVGEKFDRKMKADGGIFEADSNICHCIVGLRNISKAEQEAIEKGKITLSLSYIDGVIFICLNADDTLMFDMPFNMGLYPKFQLESLDKGGYMMPIFLVDNATNILKAMRVVGLGESFSKMLYDFSKEQWENKITDYDLRLFRINLEYSAVDIAMEKLAENIFEGENS